jgi:asparagine synthase (glutamine-hydrolysing)
MIDLALSIPIHRKHEGTRLKILLKEAAKPWLPVSLLTRSKVGFRTPMTEILKDLPASFVHDLLQKDTSSFWDFFDASRVCELLEALYSRGENVGWQVWALLCIREWFRLYLESREGCQ